MTFSSKFRTLVTATTLTALVAGLVVTTGGAADAAPQPAAARPVAGGARTVSPMTAASSDASLSGLTMSGSSMTDLAPAFDPATHDYQVINGDVPTASITPVTNDPNASFVVTGGATTPTVTSGTASLSLNRGRNDISVVVTSADNTKTETYRVTAWRLAAPKPTIVGIADATTTVLGGTKMSVTLANGMLPNQCSRAWKVGTNGNTHEDQAVLDPATGLTRIILELSSLNPPVAGLFDLQLTVTCNVDNDYLVSTVTKPDAVTYISTLKVDSIDAPNPVSFGDAMTIHGFGITEYSDVHNFVSDSTGQYRPLSDWDFTGNDNEVVYADYYYDGDPFWATSRQLTVSVTTCPDNSRELPDCTAIYTRKINWQAPAPKDVSFSPVSGPQAGGTTVRLRGRYIISGNDHLVVKVGDQVVQSTSSVFEAGDDGETFADYTQGYDLLDIDVPPSATTGPVPITVSNSYGTTVARGMFTYSARPTVTDVAPATVANTGGSIVTVTGTNFGTSGRPTVIIGGTKSPLVTRLSATTLTAVVPASANTTGPVDVVVASTQGGGISAAGTLTLAAAGTLPTVTTIAPTSGRATDEVTVTGTGFGPAGTAGVSVDGNWVVPTASSPTSLTFEVPATDTAGAMDLVVGSVTGAVTKANGFTVLADAGVTSVTPAQIASYATGSAATITLDGAGFGTTGTVKVGSAAAVKYTATAGGTRIAGVVVPTTVAGSLPVVVTPTGAKTALRGSVYVNAPTFTYVGTDPHQREYGPGNIEEGEGGVIVPVPTSGGTRMRIEGSGFGPGGTLKIGTATVTPASWADGLITFIAPTQPLGYSAVTVTPTHSTLAATRAKGINYVPVTTPSPTLRTIASVVDYNRDQRNEFDPTADASNAFTVTGDNLAGKVAGATRVVVRDGNQTFTIVPTSVTATSLTFAAPRGFTSGNWKNVSVVTDSGSSETNYGIYYLNAGVTITASPTTGLCKSADVAASGSVVYQPAVVTVTSSSNVFGTAGTVKIDGVAVTPSSYTANKITFSMTTLASALANPWGPKSIVVTPTGTSLTAQSAGFTCGVTPTVTTTANGSASALTVAAGTAYTPGFTTSGIIGSFTAAAPAGYEYVAAADYNRTGFYANVRSGVPAAAGDYYVRVSLARATYDAAPYLGFTPAPVHVTITGTPVTITPVSDNGASFVYKGQLGDGTGSSPTDVHYTATTTTDRITAVTYEYRDSVCESQAATLGWTEGLPSDVARSSTACGGDGTTQSKWDVRVKTFAMKTSGTDRSIYYQATLPYTQITITPRPLTVAAVRADRVYDGTDTAVLGDLTVTGAVAGENVTLANGSGGGTFADAAPGVNKPVTLGQDLTLAGSAAGNYTLTNPRPTIVGTITKASAVLGLAASTSSVVLTQNTPVTITSTVNDTRGGAIADSANAAPVVLTSLTPTVCTISGTTVTAIHAGTCTVAGTQASSANYNAATAASDPTSLTETVEFAVYPAPQKLSVVADDLTVAVGDSVNPTSQVSGLFDGDTVDNLEYDYYSGRTLLTGVPSEPGTYRVVPKAGTLTAANDAVYANPTSFAYVAGTLVVTALPPTIDKITAATGPTTGGNTVTITGTRLDTVRVVRIGAVTLRSGDFTVSPDGTSLTFTAPKVAQPGPVALTLAAGTASAADTYVYTTPTATAPSAPRVRSAVGQDKSITVTFTPPAATGGASITSYQVSTDGGRTWHTAATKPGAAGTLTTTVPRLTNGVNYPVQVRAVNDQGVGPASTTTRAVPHGLPGAPVAVHAAGRNGKVALTFAPPAATGGARITGYQVSTDGGRSWHTVSSAATSSGRRTATVSGLSNGVFYRVAVRAVTAYGHGPAAAAGRVTPNAAALGNVKQHPSSQVAVPKHPKKYRGPHRITKAYGTSHNGTWAHPIPEVGARQLTAGEAVMLSKDSLFEFDSARLTKEGRAEVKFLAHRLRLAHGLTCEGYTDYAGKAGHELTLSQRRAVAVCNGLKHYGARLKTKAHGYGGSRPVVVGGSAQSRAANRRVVVIVTS